MKIRLIRYFPYFLFFYHLLFACIAYDYVNRNNGDAVQYWFVGKNLNAIRWSDFLGPGTDAVKLITYPLVAFLKMPPLLGCVLFSMLSGYGFIRLWNLAKNTGNQHKYLPVVSALILLLPNAHFWTSLIGKESLLFLPMVLLTEMIYKEKYYSVVGFISLLIIAWIRPHLAFVIVLALGIALFWKGNLNRKAKTLWLAAGFLAVTGLCFLLQKLTHAQESLFLKIQSLYAAHNLKLKNTDAYVPLEDYVYPYKIFTFFFRPFPFEKEGMVYAIVGAEGLIGFLVFGLIFYMAVRCYQNISWSVSGLFSLILLMAYATMYVYAYANFGMILRARALLIPVILIVVIQFFCPTAPNRFKRF